MRSIDPIHSVAFSIQANPGVYAVLVGSGVSRAAKIPTGWEITLDLIRKLAKLSGETCEPDPERWYLEKFDKEASYSDLLNELAKTQTERQQLLRGYFEPIDEEPEEGVKAPTAAHRAIASLAEKGFVRVIITTNFDQLVETALADEGVVPTILSSPDQVKGALPLIHTQCCVFKVNGDYLDTRIRNTPAELDEYPKEFNELLDRIFDEFGLVVCGWSAEWDGALRNALFRAPSRRFTTYWASRGTPGEEAQRLIDHRRADLILIDDADSFFVDVQQHVESIEEYSRPHPLSTEVAVASLKRYISEPRHRIRLSDLVDVAVNQVLNAASIVDSGELVTQQPNRGLVTASLRAYESTCSTLLAIASIGGYWAEDDNLTAWERAIQRLSAASLGKGTSWFPIKTYPTRLLLYAFGIGVVESGKLCHLNRILSTTVNYGPTQYQPENVTTALFNIEVTARFPWGRLLDGMEESVEPLSEWIHDALRQPLKNLIADEQKYSFVFDKLEILIALGFGYRTKFSIDWFPPGAFFIRSQTMQRLMTEITDSVSELGDTSSYVKCGIFGSTHAECMQSLENFERFVSKVIRGRGL